MQRELFKFVSAVSMVGLMLGAEAAMAQKNGGVLKAYHRGTPPSGSIHEEATNSTVAPYMGVFNNLIMYDQAIAVESLDTIVPDLASKWASNDDNTKLTFDQIAQFCGLHPLEVKGIADGEVAEGVAGVVQIAAEPLGFFREPRQVGQPHMQPAGDIHAKVQRFFQR